MRQKLLSQADLASKTSQEVKLSEILDYETKQNKNKLFDFNQDATRPRWFTNNEVLKQANELN